MMTNAVTIFQQCADMDLVNRLSNLKQCPQTGQLYTRNQWSQEKRFRGKGKNNEEEEDKGEHVSLSRFLMIMVFCILLFIVLLM